jgi:hypothetical protein
VIGIAIFVFFEVLCLVIACLVFFNRSDKFIKASDIGFLYVMSIGIFLAYVNFLLQFYDGTKAKCIAENVIFHIAYSITFGALIIKTWVCFLVY